MKVSKDEQLLSILSPQVLEVTNISICYTPYRQVYQSCTLYLAGI